MIDPDSETVLIQSWPFVKLMFYHSICFVSHFKVSGSQTRQLMGFYHFVVHVCEDKFKVLPFDRFQMLNKKEFWEMYSPRGQDGDLDLRSRIVVESNILFRISFR